MQDRHLRIENISGYPLPPREYALKERAELFAIGFRKREAPSGQERSDALDQITEGIGMGHGQVLLQCLTWGKPRGAETELRGTFLRAKVRYFWAWPKRRLCTISAHKPRDGALKNGT